MSEFLTPSALAREIGMSPETVRLLCCKGAIAGARKVGARWVIHRPTFAASFAGARTAGRGLAVPRPSVPPGALARIVSAV